MNVIGFAWFYANFLIALGLTRILQIWLAKMGLTSASAGLGALV